jgi:hypothetical protein
MVVSISPSPLAAASHGPACHAHRVHRTTQRISPNPTAITNRSPACRARRDHAPSMAQVHASSPSRIATTSRGPACRARRAHAPGSRPYCSALRMHPSPSTTHVTMGPVSGQLLSSLVATARCSSPLQLQQLPTIGARGSPCNMSVFCPGHSCTFISPNMSGSIRCPSERSPPPTAAVHSMTAT